ncbi:MAG: sugar ABC transporter substrate-binding protein [Chloroflexi bacterium]|nr:MAG: sugar ABC transporter substrate-binding protein [Chloroflexota bacterium]TMF78580.1 MAG: sugar ABC transporter substrate-binding protein [Chloroflexota bacterium]TMF79181.1 MAG: sugar ABC transporter substrate-binding protein [Chloroflexota bacterium]TMF91720.1 MAG: sugar ABC transporter substrate-binding protein [Chloroflexota bacterium]TMG45919.1 MAG: sugar ABC transporter substrate-binding protein [Chloroflexota bacterium]
MRRFLAKALVLVAGVGLIVSCTSGSSNNTSSSTNFSGTTIRVVTFTGPQIAEPLQRRAPDFEKLTGAKVQVITVPFADLYQKLLTDFATKTNSYDATVFDPQWMGDYVPPGYLEDLTDRVQKDSSLQWNDIAPFFRDFSATFKGKVYTVPLDGDFQMVYYRKDLLQKDGLQPPATWDDYISIAKHFQGKDLNGDGKNDYGSCLAMKRSAQSYWAWISIAAAYLQSKGTKQGAFFNTDNMQPLTNNPGAAAALDVYKQLSKIGPPDQLNNDVGDSRGLFVTGRCALSLDWGDIGTLAIDPTQSKVQDKVGAVILPGSKRVLDRSTNQLADCNATLCPNAVNGVNHAPFAAFGGWSGAINKASSAKVKDAAFAFLSYMSAPKQSGEDVTIGKTGFNPYRTSQFTNLDNWTKAGMSTQAANDYLGAIKSSLQSPNMVLDLRIPQSAFYEQTALDQALAQFLAGEISLNQTMTQITNQWNSKTDEIGRQGQLDAYKSSLSITK